MTPETPPPREPPPPKPTPAKPTIVDVAARAGVSKKTVSRAINKSPLLARETRMRVETAIADLGFVPDPQARALALRRNFLIALVTDTNRPSGLTEIQHGMLAALHGSDYALCLHAVDGGGRNVIAQFGDFLEYHRPGGIVFSPPLFRQDELAGLAWEYGCPALRLAPGPHDGAPDVIWSDDRAAAARAVGHLVVLGHRRIAFVGGLDTDDVARERELGYLDAMAEHGLDRGPSLIAAGEGGVESGREAAALLLELSPAPTAILAANDSMAAGTLQAAHNAGFAVPETLSVIGFGDSPLAGATIPPLASLRIPLRAMAHAAVRALLNREAPLPPLPYCADIVSRASLAPPPG